MQKQQKAIEKPLKITTHGKTIGKQPKSQTKPQRLRTVEDDQPRTRLHRQPITDEAS